MPIRMLPETTHSQIRTDTMPMLDVYAPAGIFSDKKALAKELAETIMRWEKVPAIPFFTDNTAAFIHELEPEAFSTAGGSSDHVRVNVTTNAGALNRDQQLGLVKDISALIAKAAGDASLEERTWVALTEAVPGGWGIGGHAYTNEEIVQTVRELLGKE
jgi:phenylpyruvate tautomerase PptA (4-oxalocrotonate tautomerase family)